MKVSKLNCLVLTILTSLSLSPVAHAGSPSTLTVVVDGIRHQKGQICLRLFSNERGFPSKDNNKTQSTCTRITGGSIKQQFSGLKPGNYAVAVVDDQNGDRKLNRDFLGIPKEGFGISQNPTVSILTGEPKFRDSSFLVNKNTTIKIMMKYSLDS